MIYFGIALFCTGVFIVQFILSIFFGDLDFDADFDVDFDGEPDFSLSDILSFKSLIHFGLGFGWSMWFSQDKNQFLAACISIVVGIVFVIVLFGLYKLANKLEHKVIPEKGKDLVGRNAEIYLKLEGKDIYTAYTIINSSRRQIKVQSESGTKYRPGDEIKIIKFEDGIYYIL